MTHLEVLMKKALEGKATPDELIEMGELKKALAKALEEKEALEIIEKSLKKVFTLKD